MKASFIDINDIIFFSKWEKIATYLIFHLFDVLSRKNQSKTCTKQWGFRFQTRRRLPSCHFFRTHRKLHCSIVLCAKPCGKRLLLCPEKILEGTLYSVPSFAIVCLVLPYCHFSWRHHISISGNGLDCFTRGLSAKHFIRRWIWFLWKRIWRGTHFHLNGLVKKTHFETEAKLSPKWPIMISGVLTISAHVQILFDCRY